MPVALFTGIAEPTLAEKIASPPIAASANTPFFTLFMSLLLLEPRRNGRQSERLRRYTDLFSVELKAVAN